MHDLRTIQPHKHLRALGLVLLGALCALQVVAAPISSSQSGNSVTYSSSSYGSDAAIAGAALTVSAGVVYATQPSTLRTLSGAVAPLVVRAAPVAGAIGSTVAACFANPLCVVATAAAAAYVANELSYGYDASSGLPVVTKADPTVCTAAPCYGYYARSYVTGNFDTATRYSSAAQACARTAANGSAWSANYNYSVTGSTLTSCYLQLVNKSDGNYVASEEQGTGRHSIPPQTAAPVPATTQELSDAIGAKNDWSNDSKITELLEQIVKNTSQSIPLQIPSVTGPTSIPGTPTVTTKADGSKTTTTKTSSLGYFGPRVDVTETTVVQDTTPAGVTTTTTTTEEPAYVEEEAPATDYDTPQVDIPKATKTITFAAENLGFGGGTCPADVMSQPHGMAAPIKLVDWTNNCNYVTTYAKPMILALALFSALMIIFVGGKPE